MVKAVLTAAVLFTGLTSGAQERIELSILQEPYMAVLINETQQRMEDERIDSDTRGLLGTAIDFTANFATRALTTLIDNAQKKRIVEWTAPTTRDYFYNDVSYLGPLDPTGMQFSGFTMKRVLTGENQDTVMYLKCSVPQDRIQDFISNSRFTLEIDSLSIDLSKVRAKYTAKKNISIEITITVVSTWIDQNLSIHKDQQLGEFRICANNLTYDKNDPIITYSQKDAKNMIAGFCFFIPRSYSAYTSGQEYRECWGRGEFDINVSVKESTARKASRGPGAQFVIDYIQTALPGTLTDITLNQEIVGSEMVKIISNY